jgi:hypothetical protein
MSVPADVDVPVIHSRIPLLILHHEHLPLD